MVPYINRRVHGCRLGVNHFADWTQEEFEALMLPNKGRERPSLQNTAFDGERVRLHKPALGAHLLPAEVNWQGTPADSPVKDQACCGSCWVRACDMYTPSCVVSVIIP